MNKLDELMVLNAQLDTVLGDIKKANKHLEAELNDKRSAAQEQMVSDIAALRGYMKKVGMSNVVLNTGLRHPDYNMVFYLKICTITTEIGLETKTDSRPNYNFHRWVKTDIPFAEEDYGSNEYIKGYVFTIMKHWDVAYANMQNDLFDKMQEFMAKKASKVMDEQRNLVAALDDFDRKE